MDNVLEYLSHDILIDIYDDIKKYKDNIEEIRIRLNKPVAIKADSKNIILNHVISFNEIQTTFEKICENSVYSYKNQICEGYITIKGGHRVGITGNCVFENGQVLNINYISSLNFRIAREKKGCAEKIIQNICNKDRIYNTLIASRPGSGKTTMLRDIIRTLSNMGKTCGIVDERGEIAALSKGIPQNDVGDLTDIIDNVSKSKGMHLLIRSMAPQVIACDEIGSKEDTESIEYAICSGITGIFTAHGSSLDDLKLNPQLSELLEKNILHRIIFLSSIEKGKIEKIYALHEKEKKYELLEI